MAWKYTKCIEQKEKKNEDKGRHEKDIFTIAI